MRVPQPTVARLHKAFLPALTTLVVGCALAAGPTTSLPSSTAGGIAIPAEQLTAFDRCMLDHGFRIAQVKPPSLEGGKPSYVYESDHAPEQGFALMTECRNEFAPYQEKTSAELREIYDRWVAERECLIALGYEPAEPPSLEKFMSDWRSGPWTPIDGIDTQRWTDVEYRDAKERCTLEMYDRS